MKKKLLAGFMTLCMLLSLLPTAVFAVETEAEPSTEQTVPVKEEAGSQPDGGRADNVGTTSDSLTGSGTQTDPYVVTLQTLPALGELLESGTTSTMYVKAGENITLPTSIFPRDARLIWISVGLLYRSPTVAPMLPLKTMGP